MLPVNLLSALKLAIEPRPQPSAAATPPPPKDGPQLEPNQKLQGIVQDQVSPGVFKVRVAEQLVQMQLPPATRSGDTIAVQVVSVRPRLTFSLVGSTMPLSTAEQLGSTAKLLSAMSQQPPEKAFIRAAQNSPLWDKPQPPESRPLAGLLRDALGNSGLFYESHQAQWMAGARSIAQLRAEPQNLPPDQARVMMAGNAPPPEKDAVRNGMALPDQSAPATPGGKVSDVPEHLQPLVQQQLNALETRQMIWQGYIWPGQAMQWEIHDEAPPHPSMPEGQRQWTTELRLDLPRLGPVTATLHLNGASMHLAFLADKTETRTALGSASTRLIAALKDAGIAVTATRIAAP